VHSSILSNRCLRSAKPVSLSLSLSLSSRRQNLLSASRHAGKTHPLPLSFYTPAKHVLSVSLYTPAKHVLSLSLSTCWQNMFSLSLHAGKRCPLSLSLYTPAKHALSLSSACPADIFTTEVAIDVTTHHQQIFKKLIKILTMTGMHKISYDLPIGFYPRDFFFEKINKDCWIFCHSKYWLHLGESQLSGAGAPSTRDSPSCSQYFDLQKIQTNLVYHFK